MRYSYDYFFLQFLAIIDRAATYSLPIRNPVWKHDSLANVE